MSINEKKLKLEKMLQNMFKLRDELLFMNESKSQGSPTQRNKPKRAPKAPKLKKMGPDDYDGKLKKRRTISGRKKA